MQKAATFYLFSAVTMGCLALATTINCGGNSGERPSATGGTGGGSGGAGGSGGGSGGSSSTSSGLNCAAAIVPADGKVTDFTDWSSSNGRWGSSDGLYGNIYGYKDSQGSTMSAGVDTASVALHATGAVVDTGWGGVGIGFSVCTTVASFSQVQFDIMGSSAGCDMELQVKTFDQQPTSQSPPGGCDPNGSCYNFPVKKQVVDLSVPITMFTTVKVPLADVENWSAANAAQVIGLQWQWSGTHVELDASTGCPIDVMITNVKFLP